LFRVSEGRWWLPFNVVWQISSHFNRLRTNSKQNINKQFQRIGEVVRPALASKTFPTAEGFDCGRVEFMDSPNSPSQSSTLPPSHRRSSVCRRPTAVREINSHWTQVLPGNRSLQVRAELPRKDRSADGRPVITDDLQRPGDRLLHNLGLLRIMVAEGRRLSPPQPSFIRRDRHPTMLREVHIASISIRTRGNNAFALFSN
jgi:hypothetical protein